MSKPDPVAAMQRVAKISPADLTGEEARYYAQLVAGYANGALNRRTHPIRIAAKMLIANTSVNLNHEAVARHLEAAIETEKEKLHGKQASRRPAQTKAKTQAPAKTRRSGR